MHAEINTSQVQQVLLNLIINARQAMQDGGQLVVSVSSNTDDNMAEILVSDTGSGISEEKLHELGWG